MKNNLRRVKLSKLHLMLLALNSLNDSTRTVILCIVASMSTLWSLVKIVTERRISELAKHVWIGILNKWWNIEYIHRPFLPRWCKWYNNNARTKTLQPPIGWLIVPISLTEWVSLRGILMHSICSLQCWCSKSVSHATYGYCKHKQKRVQIYSTVHTVNCTMDLGIS